MGSLELRLRNEVGQQLSQRQLDIFFLCFLGEKTSIVRLTFHDAGKLNLFPEQSGPISPGWGQDWASLPAVPI